MATWTVAIRVTLDGYAVVEASDKSSAEELVRKGYFDLAPGAAMVDWERRGSAREDK